MPRFKFLFIMGFCLLTFGCSVPGEDVNHDKEGQEPVSTGDVTQPTMVANNIWDTLHFSQCDPPCWLGIIPGLTSSDEADKILNSYYQVEAEVVGNRLYLEWTSDENGPMRGGTIVVDNDVVESISLRVSIGSVNVGDVIAKLGDPQYTWWVVGDSSPPNTCGENMELYYSDKQTLIILPPIADTTDVTPSTPVSAIVFLSSTSPITTSRYLTPPLRWVGYEGDYCP